MYVKRARIIFEDEAVLVVDKPAGLVVNRSQTIKEGTLQDELSDYFKLGNGLGIGDRAGIVHRLDKETSGFLVVAKTRTVFENLQNQFKKREVTKKYIALVHGIIKEKTGFVETPIARMGRFGKFGVVDMYKRRSPLVKSGQGTEFIKNYVESREARTDYEVEGLYEFRKERLEDYIYSSRERSESRSYLKNYDSLSGKFSPLVGGSNNNPRLTKARLNYLKQNAREYSLLNVFPKTGRTHQIRVHLKSIGHFVVSDLIYSPNKLIDFDLSWCPRLFLHASSITFVHPKTKKTVSFESDLPNDLKDAMLNLKEIKSYGS